MRVTRKRNGRGASLVETVVAACILVPIALFMLDVSVLVLANSINDTAAKNAARAAANQENGAAAYAAAARSLSTVRPSPIIRTLILKRLVYPASKDAVTCQTEMVVKLPIPFPGFSEFTFLAQSVEPIVGARSS